MNTVKLSTVFMATVVAIAFVGVAYAHWTATLTISGTVNTGSISPVFTDAFTDDDETVNNPDKDSGDTGPDPKEPGPSSAEDPIERHDKNVGSSSATIGEDGSVTITVSDAYPCYWTTAWMDIENQGTVPVKVSSISLTVGGTTEDIEPCTTYYIDFDTGTIDETPDDGDDMSIHVTPGDLLDKQIDPGAAETQMDVEIHLLQDAEQDATYTFSITVNLVQWNTE